MLFRRKKKNERLRMRGEKTFSHHIFWGVLKLLLLGVVLYLTYYVTRLPVFTITEVIIEGGETVSHEEIKGRVLTELVGNYFVLVPKRFTYLYPHDRIIEALANVPRIYDIQITRTSRSTIVVSFAEYMPHALACVHAREDVPCFFINTDGFAFAEAPSLRGGAITRHAIEGLEEITKSQVLDTTELHALESLIGRIENELGFRVTTVVHKKDKDFEFYVNGGGSILVSGTRDFDASFENLKAVLASKEFGHIRPGNFQYIDIRFGEKIFVNESAPESEVEAESGTTTVASTTLPE